MELTGEVWVERTRFYYNAVASLAKAIAFRSTARSTLKRQDRLTSTITAYYSLFHLTLFLMFILPQRIDETLHDRLKNAFNDGTVDPSPNIKHQSAFAFIKSETSKGLTPEFLNKLELARGLRNDVNYGPRIEQKNGRIIFRHFHRDINDCDELVEALDNIIIEATKWGNAHSLHERWVCQTAVSQCIDYFIKDDLFYKQWCPEDVIHDALEFLSKLETEVFSTVLKESDATTTKEN